MIEYVSSVVRSVFRKGVRTYLTIMAISVGVMSVIIISALSDAGAAGVKKELDSLGLSGISVSSESSVLLEEDDLPVVSAITGVSDVSSVYSGVAYGRGDDKDILVTLWGCGEREDDNGLFSMHVISGRRFDRSEIDSAENVCILDKKAAGEFFGDDEALGRTLTLFSMNGTQDFEVVGIAESDSLFVGSVTGQLMNQFVYLPNSTLCDCMGGEMHSIAVSLDDGKNAKEMCEKIKSTLQNEKGVATGIVCDDLAQHRSTLDGIMNIVTGVLSVICMVSLAVSGLGIMTIMLVSVGERKGEIGIKKAIGASFWQILAEFLCEAALLGIIGGVIGIILSLIFAKVSGLVVSFGSVVVAFLSALISGVLFGLYPAIKAALMTPVAALRND